VNISPIIPIYFFYGLAFFSMGLLVMLEGGRSSDARLRRALRPLAAFGLVHAVNEWLEMFEVIGLQGGHISTDWLSGIRLATLAFSFISLAAFGSYLLVVSKTAWRLILLVPLGLEAVWVFGLILLKGQYSLPLLWDVSDVWTRYSLAIPSALLAAIGLVIQQRVFRQARLFSFGRDALWAAVAFSWYGLVGQLFVRSSPLPPSNVINEVLFNDLSGIPVQLFRAIMAGLAAFFVIRFLRAFQVENDRQISSLQEARLKEAKQRERLRGELYKRVVAAQESERQRIARELHDETGQALTAIGLGLRGLTGSLRTSKMDHAKQNLHQLELLTAHSLDELQRLIADLRPSHLDDLGLSSALRWYASTLQERTKLEIHVEIQGEEREVASPVKIALFRIAQEALTNVVKHAQATYILVVLSYSDESVFIRVLDNGQGFDTETIRSAKRVSWGLKGMEERTSLLGGRFEVHSGSGQGTEVKVSIPYLQEDADENSPAAGG
jgi:signal transduction histidine kinase